MGARAKVLVVGALAESLVNFRGPLITAMVSSGHDVTAMANYTDQSTCDRIRECGADFVPYPVQRSGLSPFDDLATFRALRRTFSLRAPDVVLAYTIKPVVWSGTALRTLASNTRFVPMITGLGLAFQGGGTRRRLLKATATHLYRMSLARAESVIFQNNDNRDTFAELGITNRGVVVNGSGVDLLRFSPLPLEAGPLTFLMIARLLGDKGVREFAQAAAIVRRRYPDTRFHLVGPPDPSPNGVPLAELQEVAATAGVTYLGSTLDVRPFIAKCHVYVLPSYHEGMPRSVLEAMAVGRAVVTTDVPGCRETVTDGDNGFLVPPRDGEALARAMVRFVVEPELAAKMGKRSRELAEERFDVLDVNHRILTIAGLKAAS